MAGSKGDEAAGRLHTCLNAAQELYNAGHAVHLIFDGAGTQTLAEISDKKSRYHQFYLDLRGAIDGACEACAISYKVRDQLVQNDARMLHEHLNGPSFKKYVDEDYTITTF